MKLRLNSMIKTLLILSIIGFVMIAFRIINQRSIRFAFLIWNLFLAWIPLFLSSAMKYINKNKRQGIKKTIYLLALGFCWLIFYPNAPYIVTDVIHLSVYNYYTISNSSYNFDFNFIMWYDLVLVMLFIFTGYIIGHISLYRVHKIVEDKYKKSLGWIFIFIVSNLSGFAIFLGRFLRLNSWEFVTNPKNLFRMIFESINSGSLKFTFMFGLFIFLIYIVMYNLSSLKKSEDC
ncbi:DUF1361 domain-containing protein [Maledivibacter halophilus]|uniref:Uncharacterized membrane protein n=1 Tax=Maledivibacter halophilus TaxID=36842 RepID=A0A1T5MMA5_9FIRM|nr:DUF1361 domain-containing protein [Maledivibacter halophilus]SKC88999.1 Uncharacterized membrane protein [Maledivibacter halophilus]